VEGRPIRTTLQKKIADNMDVDLGKTLIGKCKEPVGENDERSRGQKKGARGKKGGVTAGGNPERTSGDGGQSNFDYMGMAREPKIRSRNLQGFAGGGEKVFS